MLKVKKIYKFGGASVKDAAAVRNLAGIMSLERGESLLMVVSAMGKTTNMLEKVLERFRAAGGELGWDALSEVVSFHREIMLDLFDGDAGHPVFAATGALFGELYAHLRMTGLDYDRQYDQTVSFGELLSTTIVHEFLKKEGFPSVWTDAREYVATDLLYRSATVDWEETARRVASIDAEEGTLLVTQGFIGAGAGDLATTTLGREGSDYSAAIFANCMGAEEVTIWKDVSGLLNADPKRFKNTEKIPHISYSEAIELAFYGATIIHPKTIKPLQNKGITLKVRSFLDPSAEPTVIDSFAPSAARPSYIVKDGQDLVSFSPRDYSFMNEHNLQIIFSAFDELHIHANMVQTSALMLSICSDHDEEKLKALINRLSGRFSIKYNSRLQLFTVRHYDSAAPSPIEEEFLRGKRILVKQSSRSTLQYVLEATDRQ